MINYKVEAHTQEIQQYALEILTCFHEICEKNQLNYILDFGTLLGAVRHEGFIPWDDDIDVAMPREDFKKLQKIMQTSSSNYLFLQTHDSDPNYYNSIAKVRIPDNRYTENAMQYFDIVHGPWLDIFIYDYKFDDKEKQLKTQKSYNEKKKFYSVVMNALYSKPGVYYNRIERVFKKVLRYIFKKSQEANNRGFVMHYVDSKYEKLDQVVKSAPQDNLQGDMITYTFPAETEAAEKGLSLNRIHFENRKLQKFEGEFFYIPVDYDQILQDRYGDYMKLPPEDERKSNHHWVI